MLTSHKRKRIISGTKKNVFFSGYHAGDLSRTRENPNAMKAMTIEKRDIIRTPFEYSAFRKYQDIPPIRCVMLIVQINRKPNL